MNANRIFELLETHGCTEDKSVLKAIMQVWIECSADNMVEVFELKEKVKKLEEQVALPPPTYRPINPVYPVYPVYPLTTPPGTPGNPHPYPTVTCSTQELFDKVYAEKDKDL